MSSPLANPKLCCSHAPVKLSEELSPDICKVPRCDCVEWSHAMRFFSGLLVAIWGLAFIAAAEDSNSLLDNIFEEIKTVLNAEESHTRQHGYPHRPQNNGISLGVYEALRSIARNDELECISRLLCEAAAGGQPGYTGKEIKFDKLSLTKLMSYLTLDRGSSSPLLIYGKAALLGVSNRGDPYSCIINYPKCPKDQSRLLYYLNNHRGGFFQYFDKQHHKPGNYYYQNQYRPIYQKYQSTFKRNKIQFERPGGLYEKLKKKATNDVYATKYTHSSLSFPREYNNRNKPMVFPSSDGLIDPRILSKPLRTPAEENSFFFSNSNRFPKKLTDSSFFPKSQLKAPQAAVPTDRLPSRFFFSDSEGLYTNYPPFHSPKSFFPTT